MRKQFEKETGHSIEVLKRFPLGNVYESKKGGISGEEYYKRYSEWLEAKNKELIELLKECKAQNDDIKMHNEYCEWEIEFEDKVKKAITNT